MHETTRHGMVEGQLRPNHVNNAALLARFEDVTREDFVPAAYRQTAYADTITPLPHGRGMFAPMTLARLLQALDIKAEDRLLIVAGNTGYSAALVAPLCARVVMTEDDAGLLRQARAHLRDFANVEVAEAAPTQGYAKQGAYNAILLDCAGEMVPTALIAQLAEGGRLAAVSVGRNGLLTASLYTKHGGAMFAEELFETKGPLHPALNHPAGFVF